ADAQQEAKPDEPSPQEPRREPAARIGARVVPGIRERQRLPAVGANLAARTSCDRQRARMKAVLTALGLGALLALANYWVLWNLGGAPACVPCAAVLLGGPFALALALAGILPAPRGATPAAAPPAPQAVAPGAP